MKFGDTVRGLARRWYILVPALLIVASITVGAWFAVPPGYSRSATQLLIPGESSIPEGQNPYLYLGGLSPAADVLVRAVGSENVLNDVIAGRPGMEIEISRDTTTAGPIILIEVTASSDAAADEVLTMLIERTATVLDEIQEVENLPESTRMTVVPVTVDEQSTEQQRGRLVAAAGVAALGAVLAFLITGFVDGASRRRLEEDEAAPSARNDGAEVASPDPDSPSDPAPPAENIPARLDAAQPAPAQPHPEYLPTTARSRVKW